MADRRVEAPADDGGLGTAALVDSGDLLGADGGRWGLEGGGGGGGARAGAATPAARAGAGAARGGSGSEVGGGGGLKVETKVNEPARGLGRSHNCLIPVGL